jgi:hypothetical protein
LSDNCFQCHGPDKAKRKAKLRLDTEEGAFADRDGYQAIVPGNPGKSEVIRRITSEDDSERMPPAASARKLTGRQIELIRRWIEQGAKWQKHWAFLPPGRPIPPTLKNRAWPRNPIDIFVLQRLEREGLAPSPEADRTTLIRRVTLDLTGLPPTPGEMDAFLTDHSPNAYEKVIDRLLQSPRYGERMAIRWLDAARYADTNGYQNDGERFMWRWRDWVIDAFNRNLPFDQFTIEQIAGDMLPNALLDQQIATGFNRNHRGNAEGGIIPEEYAVEYVVDRVDTTATVWLGLTMTCARCHDHKYDPIKQKEYYQVFAYFNNVPEHGKAVKYGNSPPMIKAPTREQQEKLEDLKRQLKAAETAFVRLQPQLAADQAEWEKSVQAAPPIEWSLSGALIALYPLDGNTTEASGHQPSARIQDGEPAYASGPQHQSAVFDGKRFVDAGNVGNFGFYDKFSLGAWILPRGDQGGIVLSRMTDTARAEGYSLVHSNGKLQVNLVKRWLDDALRVETAERLTPDCWHHVMATYDGSRVAAGIKVYVDGKLMQLKVALDDLNQSFQTSEPLRIGADGGPENRFRGLIADVRVHNDVLSPDELAILATNDSITHITDITPNRRTRGQALKIRQYFLENHAATSIRLAHDQVGALRQRKQQLLETIPTTMVMKEMPTPRNTFVLIRGQYDKPGEKVTPGVPSSLCPLPSGVPRNRLGFARWLVQPSNPLTGRVTVNRYWQMYFGSGLVKTVDDFGVQGEWPTHPELLDWLAVEFASGPSAGEEGKEGGWDMKALQRLIVTSATYRQSSRITPTLLQKDPDNRLLARGPRLRLSAEMIRDQALMASGLLVERLGGPSVKPYQPKGLWRELADTDYVQSHGADLYRRSLYTFWKRTVAPPSMLTFDAAGREMCTVRETRTNTPLQALTLMNEITYVETARVLAERVMTQGGATPEDRLTLAFRLVTSRLPRAAERQILVQAMKDHRARFRSKPEEALKLIRTGEFPRNERLDAYELAAHMAVASLILNLDETITKE